MDDIDYNELIKIVNESTKKSHVAYNHNGQLVPNVANLGAKAGDIAKLERQGEYYGISVEFLEDAKPLLTDRFIVRILTLLKKEDYITPLELLRVTSADQLKYVIDKWMQIAIVDYESLFTDIKKYPSYDQWITSVTHDPLLAKIKLVEVGCNQNTDQPVVPIEWIDKEFDDGYHLQEEMNKLENRFGKPPVTYAIIYSMIIQKKDTIIKHLKNIEYDNLFYIDFSNHRFDSQLANKVRKGYQYVRYDHTIIGFRLDEILEPKDTTGNKQPKEVGLLVSRLQKSIRRGRYGSKALIETIDTLNISPNYNLPEHNFMRVSASKQMVWRLFISILEDCRPYQPIDEPSLLDLILLVLITQKVLEYKFTKPALDAIKLLALLAQYNDTQGDSCKWRALAPAQGTPLVPVSDFHNAISLATNNIIMMSGDKHMLTKYYSETSPFEPFMVPSALKSSTWKKTISSAKYIYHDSDVYEDIVLSSYDMHSKPHIILYYQACIPISMTTKEISGYIWDVSSSYNVRLAKKKPKPDLVLRSIQRYFMAPLSDNPSFAKPAEVPLKQIKPNQRTKRTSFMVLFGKKYRFGGKEIVIAGTPEDPARVKINNEWSYYNDASILNGYPKRTINLADFDPPFGYKWSKNKVTTEIAKGKPIVNGKPIPYFDGSAFIEGIVPDITKSIDKSTYKLIIEIFSGLDLKFETLLKFRVKSASKLLNWTPTPSDIKKMDLELVVLTYTKIFNQINNTIMIGPVSRGGNKMQNSVNYLLEGKLWAIFNLFCYLYPCTFKPSGSLNFQIKKETSGYIHVVHTLEAILHDNKKITGTVPKIKTELWDHQRDSVNRILGGFRAGYHGFGDASNVGSGKTLTSLSIATKLIKENSETYSGVLVLLPGNNLSKTWADELKKHTVGFDIIFQENSTNIGCIKRNTIVITTMARNRDHLINHKWLLVIIDECLTVQNRNTLWTEAAWVQSMTSKHMIMMSATFFRARFDKLYYMLKMLQTNLPERRDYLDAILLESIVSQVALTQRKWTSNFNYFEMDGPSRAAYDVIDKSDMKVEVKFAKLTSFLVSNKAVKKAVTKQLSSLIARLEKKKRKCLIYARAAAEAELWSEALGIPIYPKKGQHCIVTYHDGTYGLNDLIVYDTIVMRPPQPDRLPQIRGRLDRHNQKSNNLFIEYFVLKDTIEEGLILRLNIASSFIQKYIMPLAKFYDVSVNYKKYLKEEITNDNY